MCGNVSLPSPAARYSPESGQLVLGEGAFRMHVAQVRCGAAARMRWRGVGGSPLPLLPAAAASCCCWGHPAAAAAAPSHQVNAVVYV